MKYAVVYFVLRLINFYDMKLERKVFFSFYTILFKSLNVDCDWIKRTRAISVRFLFAKNLFIFIIIIFLISTFMYNVGWFVTHKFLAIVVSHISILIYLYLIDKYLS
jgi:hypothetical protein